MTRPSLPRRIAIYARYSSDAQNPASVADQAALCRTLIASQFPDALEPIPVYADAAVSGATMRRPGLDALLDAVRRRQITLVVTEGLDRLSRSLKDIALLFETFSHYGVSIFTAHEGTISEIHVGLKGTMNALFLRDMKARVKRGQSAKIAAGLSSSSCAYGYRVVYGSLDAAGRPLNGVRAVDDTTAAVVRRIYREYAAGRSVKEIAAALNRDKIPSPSGKLWRNNTLSGSLKKQDGLLRNEIYTGKLIFNKSYVVRDPVSHKKRFVYNPPSEWTKVEVPHLRIVSDDLWQAVRTRDVQHAFPALEKAAVPSVLKEERPFLYNQHALTGLVRCGWCGGPKSLGKYARYVCSVNRYAKKCRNGRGAKEADVFRQVLAVLQKRIAKGPPFRPRFLQTCKKRRAMLPDLDDKEKRLLTRIDRLVSGLEHGIAKEHLAKRIVDLQTQLVQLRQERKQLSAATVFPSETDIRKRLGSQIDAIARSGEESRIHAMLKMLVETIVATPIPSHRNGESIAVTLREQGWPDFWRLIAK